jgi:hypothetical protein
MDFTVTVSDVNMKVLENEIRDVDTWIQRAVEEKIASVKKRMLRDWTARLNADPDVESIPANEDALVNVIVARDDYKNRVQRDAEESANRPSE